MHTGQSRISVPTLSLAFLILFSLLFSGCRKDATAPSDAHIEKGVLDLRNTSVARMIPLTGEWKFYPGLLVQDAAGLADQEFLMVPVPHEWNDFWTDHPSDPAIGFGTYRLTIMLPDEHPGLALGLDGVYSAWQVYANGRLLWNSGQVSESQKDSRAGPRGASVVLPWAEDGSLDIFLQVSNFDYREGGIRKPVFLGPSRLILEREREGQAWDLFLAGAFIVIGFYYLSLLAIRRNTNASGFFGLHCLAIAIRPLTTGHEFLLHSLPAPGWHFYLALEYASLPLSVFFFILFLRSQFSRDFPGTGIWAIGITGLFLLALPFFVETIQLSRLVGLYQAHLLLSGLFGLIMLFLAVLRKREGSLAVFLGGIPLFLGVLNDILSTRGDIPTVQLGATSLLAFVGLQGFLLSVRFARSFEQVEQLSQELGQKNRELEHLDQLKDEFLANTSHELRTPLHGIIGITESVLRGATGRIGEETRSNLRLVAASGRRLATLVNDILDYSRANHGDLLLQPRRLVVADAVDMALSLVRPLLRDKPIDLVHVRSTVPDVYADPERLNQILVNLLGNAIKFTREGQISVESTQKGEEVFIQIRDTGIGIPAEQQQLIFESFTQADGSISRQYSGTGLGLSITRNLVRLHGGEITVESAPGEGSTFCFTLPVFSGTELPGPSELEPAAEFSRATTIGSESWTVTVDDKAEGNRPSLSGETTNSDGQSADRAEKKQLATVAGTVHTLVVDDDPINLQVMRNFLSVENHSVIEATSGTEALALLQDRGPVDLVLLDVMMPGLTGYEVCRILRESHSPAQLPIVLLTARNRTEDVIEGLASGANDYLAKPFEAEELRARVRNMLALKEAARMEANMAVIQHELSMARMIQQSLLPAVIPAPPGLKIAHRYRSMVNVGGDFYDYRLNEKGLSLLIADVSGHGVPAALIVSVIKMAYSFQSERSENPAELLHELNRMLRGNVGEEFVTGCALHFSPDGKTLHAANAGHPPLLIWKNRKGEILEFRPFGRVMALLEDGGYQSSGPIQLESGDRILMYTDGAFEAHSPQGQQFGMERLKDFLVSGASMELEQWLDALLQELILFSGGETAIEDDIAFIAIEVQ